MNTKEKIIHICKQWYSPDFESIADALIDEGLVMQNHLCEECKLEESIVETEGNVYLCGDCDSERLIRERDGCTDPSCDGIYHYEICCTNEDTECCCGGKPTFKENCPLAKTFLVSIKSHGEHPDYEQEFEGYETKEELAKHLEKTATFGGWGWKELLNYIGEIK